MPKPARLLAFAGVLLAVGTACAAPAPALAASGLSARPRLRPSPLGRTRGATLPPLPWRDRIVTGRVAARAGVARRAAHPAHYYRTKRGYRVRVQLSGSYPDRREIPRSYVRFLDGLPHGGELRRLRVYIAPQSEVETTCGGSPGVLACYAPPARLMVVPGNQTASYGGVTTKFVVAHEYGHHIAANRSNDPFDRYYRRYGGTVAFGPKYWSSEKLVCAGAERVYFPGDEGANYVANPGESWAETYAHLTYPAAEWVFAPSLKPTPAALRAARRDVRHPWTHYRHRIFRASLGPVHRHRTFHFALHLDGRLTLKLAGPHAADYDIHLATGAPHPVAGHDPGGAARDRIAIAAACRTHSVAHLAATVVRRHGHGPFRLRLGYAG